MAGARRSSAAPPPGGRAKGAATRKRRTQRLTGMAVVSADLTCWARSARMGRSAQITGGFGWRRRHRRRNPHARAPRHATDLKAEATRDIAAALGGLLADVFALYLKTKNFHWQHERPAFPRLSFAARRAQRSDFRHDRPDRRTGAQDRRLNLAFDRRYRPPPAHPRQRRRLRQPAGHARRAARRQPDLTAIMRQVHNTCDSHGDVATTSLLEVWIDETERRTWFPVRVDPRRAGRQRLRGGA